MIFLIPVECQWPDVADSNPNWISLIGGGIVAGVTGLLATIWQYVANRRLRHEDHQDEEEDEQADVALAGLKAQLEGWQSYALELRQRNRELEEENQKLRSHTRSPPPY